MSIELTMLAWAIVLGLVHITIANEIPAASAHVAGHNVGLASARERIQAMSDGHAAVDVGILENRHVVTIQLHPTGSAQATTR